MTLESRIQTLKKKITSHAIAGMKIASPLFLAPMASITNAPFRLLMEDLGVGCTVSELISCKGINYNNQKTLDMLFVDKREKHCGIQLFGGEVESMVGALKFVEERGVNFIDLNLGCPVRKVVASGGGAGLLREPLNIASYFSKCRKAISIPLSVKIRTGWDELNAKEVTHIAYEEGIDFAAIHGRTAIQGYSGRSNWDYIEEVAGEAELPIIGNGDLTSPSEIKAKLRETNCQALMIGRGALRNPFIFLQAFSPEAKFSAMDYFQVVLRYSKYMDEMFDRERVKLIQLKKHAAWFSAGFPGVARFRERLFAQNEQAAVLDEAQSFFEQLGDKKKELNFDGSFLAGGHG